MKNSIPFRLYRIYKLLREILYVLPRRKKIQLGILQLLAIATALLETLNIASIMPFIAILSNKDSVYTNRYLNAVYEYAGFNTPNDFLFVIGVIMIFFLIFNNALSAFNTWAFARFGAALNSYLSSKLFEYYINQDYLFYIKTHTAEIWYRINQIQRFSDSVLINILNINSKIFSAFLIAFGLLFLKPTLTLIVILLTAGAYLFIYKVIKKKLSEIGIQIGIQYRKISRVTSESLSANREIKIYNLEKKNTFLHETARTKLNYVISKSKLYGVMPRYIVESVAFSGILGICLYLISSGNSTDRVFTTVSIFALAGYRLLPVVQSIYVSFTELKANIDSFHSIKHDIYQSKEFENKEYIDFEPLPFTKGIQLKSVSFSYPTANTRQISNLDIEIKKNLSVAVVGKTGCGKTTLINIILGLLYAEDGQMYVDGTPINKYNVKSWQKNISYVAQDIFLYDATIAENVAFGIHEITPADEERIIEALKTACLYDFVEKLPKGIYHEIGERGIQISGGQRQRLAIARALFRKPQLLVLDEATSALDQNTEKQIMQAIDNIQGSLTLIMIAHRMATVKNCDRIFLMDDGKIIASGTYNELLESSPEFRRMAS